ncbi:MAG: hypothetical protein ACTSR8_02500 [Promethearchaeota archaeon]
MTKKKKENVDDKELEKGDKGDKEKFKRKNYNYTYCQFTASVKEKELVEKYATKENFKTMSDFLRRIVFDYIRKKRKPRNVFIA